MSSYRLYRCNKCGFVLSTDSDIAQTVCTYPMAVRASGICGGSFKLVLSSDIRKKSFTEI